METSKEAVVCRHCDSPGVKLCIVCGEWFCNECIWWHVSEKKEDK